MIKYHHDRALQAPCINKSCSWELIGLRSSPSLPFWAHTMSWTDRNGILRGKLIEYQIVVFSGAVIANNTEMAYISLNALLPRLFVLRRDRSMPASRAKPGPLSPRIPCDVWIPCFSLLSKHTHIRHTHALLSSQLLSGCKRQRRQSPCKNVAFHDTSTRPEPTATSGPTVSPQYSSGHQPDSASTTTSSFFRPFRSKRARARPRGCAAA